MEDALPESQEEERGGEEAEGRDGGGGGIEAEDATEDEKFADEAVEAGETERGEHRDAAEAGEERGGGAQAAEIIEAAFAAGTCFKDADTGEEGGGGETVVEHLQERAAEGGRGGGASGGVASGGVGYGEEREEAVAQMVDGRVGDHALEVGLLHRGEGAEDHAAEGETNETRGRVVKRLGEDRPEEAKETVDAHLRHDTREEHRGASRSFGVSRGEPRVEGPERNFDGETEEDAEENEGIGAAGEFCGERAVAGKLGELGEIERAGGDEEGGEADEHKGAAADGVDDELEGGARGSGAAPEFDQEKRGEEAEFPEEEPVEEIEGEEDAERGALDQEEERAEETGRLRRSGRRGEMGPGGEERDGREDAGEEDEEEAQAVETEVIVDVERGDPRVALDQLRGDRGGIELSEKESGEREGRKREREGEKTSERGARAAKEGEDGGTDPRREDNEREERKRAHTTPPKIATRARTTKPMARKRR